jgi:hypothetical protein
MNSTLLMNSYYLKIIHNRFKVCLNSSTDLHVWIQLKHFNTWYEPSRHVKYSAVLYMCFIMIYSTYYNNFWQTVDQSNLMLCYVMYIQHTLLKDHSNHVQWDDLFLLFQESQLMTRVMLHWHSQIILRTLGVALKALTRNNVWPGHVRSGCALLLTTSVQYSDHTMF